MFVVSSLICTSDGTTRVSRVSVSRARRLSVARLNGLLVDPVVDSLALLSHYRRDITRHRTPLGIVYTMWRVFK